MSDLTSKRRTLIVALGLLARAASAQEVSMPSCASSPPTPSDVIAVPGFPAERLYIHPMHPGLCSSADDRRCKPNAYVISGDRLRVSESCANWSFVEFSGKKKVTGWVASGRLHRIDLPVAELPLAESVSANVHAACLEAEALLDESLQNGQGNLPSALSASEPLRELPAGVGPGSDTWRASVSQIRIQGRSLKAVDYGSGGTCNDRSMELWTPDFKTRIAVTGSNIDSANDDGYSSETMVKLADQPYFAHITRSRRSVTLIAFDKDLFSKAICRVTELPTRHEIIKSAAEPAVCDAVLADRVEGSPIDDVEPYDLTPEALQLGKDAVGSFLRVVGHGRLDIENNGSPQEIAIVHFENGLSTAGCGHDVDTSVPIIVNADGMPVPKSAFNRKVLEQAAAGEDSRLFRFRGTTYFETRSRFDADGDLTHNVWRFTTGERMQVCEFIPVRYRAIDVHY